MPYLGLVFPEEVRPWVIEIDSKIQNRFYSLRDAFLSFDMDKRGEITESKFLEGIIQMNCEVTED